jgi:hypothetical protein
MQSNLQSKFLTGKLNIEKFNQDILQFQNTVSSGWYLEGYKLDIKNVISSLEKMKAYTLEELDLFKIDLNKSLLKQFGFSTFKHSDKANSSYDIGIKFDKRHINRIEEINLLDMEVYEYVQKIKKEY